MRKTFCGLPLRVTVHVVLASPCYRFSCLTQVSGAGVALAGAIALDTVFRVACGSRSAVDMDTKLLDSWPKHRCNTLTRGSGSTRALSLTIAPVEKAATRWDRSSPISRLLRATRVMAANVSLRDATAALWQFSVSDLGRALQIVDTAPFTRPFRSSVCRARPDANLRSASRQCLRAVFDAVGLAATWGERRPRRWPCALLPRGVAPAAPVRRFTLARSALAPDFFFFLFFFICFFFFFFGFCREGDAQLVWRSSLLALALARTISSAIPTFTLPCRSAQRSLPCGLVFCRAMFAASRKRARELFCVGAAHRRRGRAPGTAMLVPPRLSWRCLFARATTRRHRHRQTRSCRWGRSSRSCAAGRAS